MNFNKIVLSLFAVHYSIFASHFMNLVTNSGAFNSQRGFVMLHYNSGSVGMGSWEPINFRTMGSGTLQFWKERTMIRPLVSTKQARNMGWEFGTLNQHLGTHYLKS